jgi:hypothetical protein
MGFHGENNTGTTAGTQTGKRSHAKGMKAVSRQLSAISQRFFTQRRKGREKDDAMAS